MRLLLFVVQIVCVCGVCRWHSPSVMFPKRLMYLRTNKTLVNRRRLGIVYALSDEDDTDGTSDIRGVEGGKSSKEAHPNAVPGMPVYTDHRLRGQLRDDGSVHYDIVFDKTLQAPGMWYDIIAVEPEGVPYSFNMSVSSDLVSVIDVSRGVTSSLEFVDALVVWLGVYSPCVPGREVGRVPYHFNVSMAYDLYHSHRSELSNVSEWSSRGWLDGASIISHPILNIREDASRLRIHSPCAMSYMDASLTVLNTSQSTYWDSRTESYQTSNVWVGGDGAIPKCHRRGRGNMCSVLATVRLTYTKCRKNVKFSVSQAVSHVARMTHTEGVQGPIPSTFDASRRMPIVYGGDMRYDMCFSRACEGGACIGRHVENVGLMTDGDISIEQHDVFGSGYVETVCRFEVVGFLDDLWTPHVYFRQWVGYNYTVIQ